LVGEKTGVGERIDIGAAEQVLRYETGAVCGTILKVSQHVSHGDSNQTCDNHSNSRTGEETANVDSPFPGLLSRYPPSQRPYLTHLGFELSSPPRSSNAAFLIFCFLLVNAAGSLSAYGHGHDYDLGFPP